MRKLRTPLTEPNLEVQLRQSSINTPHDAVDNLGTRNNSRQKETHEEPTFHLLKPPKERSNARVLHGQQEDSVLGNGSNSYRLKGSRYVQAKHSRDSKSRIRSSSRTLPEGLLAAQSHNSKRLPVNNSGAKSHNAQGILSYKRCDDFTDFKPTSVQPSVRAGNTRWSGPLDNEMTGSMGADNEFSGLTMIKKDTVKIGVRRKKKSRKSLLEELFPEQAKDHQRVPRNELKQQKAEAVFDPPIFDEFQDEFLPTSPPNEDNMRGPTSKATLNDKTTILVLEGGDPNLSEADFRRIAPKGWHIEEWRGREDPLKIIPARDEKSLLFQNRYYLVFPDPELARAYKKRAEYLHKLAQTYTPVSFRTSMLPAMGTLVGGEDAAALVREYTIAPPSQPLSLHVIHPPYQISLLRMLAANGTAPLLHPVNRAGRSILLWVEGYQPTTWDIRHMIGRDGQDRGIRWSPAIGKGIVEQFDGQQRQAASASGDGEDDQSSELDDAEAEANKVFYKRWLVSFENEAEARRFIRVWHKRPFPLRLFDLTWEDGEPLPLVNTEFMW